MQKFRSTMVSNNNNSTLSSIANQRTITICLPYRFHVHRCPSKADWPESHSQPSVSGDDNLNHTLDTCGNQSHGSSFFGRLAMAGIYLSGSAISLPTSEGHQWPFDESRGDKATALCITSSSPCHSCRREGSWLLFVEDSDNHGKLMDSDLVHTYKPPVPRQ